MSINHTVYIGPYVLCHDTLVDQPEDFRTCMNKTCRNHNHKANSPPFCPECGHKIQGITQIQKTKKVNTSIIYENLNEVLSPVENFEDDNCYWVCNKQNPTCYSYDPCCCGELSLTYAEEYGFRIEGGSHPGILSPDDGLELFKSMYKAELDVLIAFYGEANVEVFWGILNWAS
jgi:hypothetical protein